MNYLPRKIFNSISKKHIIIIKLLYFITTIALSGEEYHFSHLTIKDGLSSNSISEVLQDSRGFIWMATASGLNRYDGNSIRSYNFSDGNAIITCLYEDSEGDIWVGSYGQGVAVYNPVKESFERLSLQPDLLVENKSLFINDIVEFPMGVIVIGTSGEGLVFFDKKQKKFINSNEVIDLSFSEPYMQITHNSVDYCGRLWVGTERNGLYYTGKDSKLLKLDKEHDGLPSNKITTVFQDYQQLVWIGTDAGLACLNPLTGTLKETETFKTLPISSICEDNCARLWIGIPGEGIIIYDPRKDIVEKIIPSPENTLSLNNRDVRHIYKDNMGIIWIATASGGINIYKPPVRDFSSYTFSSSSKNSLYNVSSLYRDTGGTLWIGTDRQGLWSVKQGAGTVAEKVILNDDKNLSIRGIASTKDEKILIIGDNSSLLQYDSKSGILNVFDYIFPQNYHTTTLIIDRKDRIWCGTELDGVVLLTENLDILDHFIYGLSAQRGASILSLYEDSSGTIWAGLLNNGLWYFDEQEQNFSQIQNPKLSSLTVQYLGEDSKGNLLVGTTTGLFKYPVQNRNAAVSFQFNTQKNISVQAVFEGPSGLLWLSTSRGVVKLDPETKQYLLFGSADGLQFDEYNRGAAVKLPNENILFGSSWGIDQIDPDVVWNNLFQPPVEITDIEINNRHLNVGQKINGINILKKSISQTESIQLPPGKNVLTLTFTVLDFTDPVRNNISLILEGSDADWIQLEEQRKISYSNLSPGEYRLRIKGATHNGHWGSNERILNIRVLPYFWETLLFKAGAVFLLFVLVAVFFLIRINILHMRAKLLSDYIVHTEDVREEERRLVARDIHDELGQMLSAMRYEIFWLNQNSEADSASRQERYKDMLTMINRTIEWVKFISKKLRPKVLDTLNLQDALAWQFREFARYTKLNLHVDIKPLPDMLNSTFSVIVYRIMQELLTNSQKHSQAENLFIKIDYVNNILKISVEDDGIGYSDEKRTHSPSFGLLGIKERCVKLNGSFNISGSPGSGTKIQINLPVMEK